MVIEFLESRALLSVAISTPPTADSITLQDVGGALVVTIDGKATYRLHSGVTILASGGDTVELIGSIAEPVTITTGANDSTTVIESTDNDLTLSGTGNVVISLSDRVAPQNPVVSQNTHPAGEPFYEVEFGRLHRHLKQ